MNLSNRITLNPEVCHGKPTIRNQRYTVELILDLLSSGMSKGEIIEDYPTLEKEDILACLEYASNLVKARL
ncbi:PF04255 family protein [Leptospira santarosai]|uniref:PF04255 family protein n=1 Tax=Leptospira santarosai TaxID=28183 RepID=A0A2P1QRW2_9LEPT|nr:PF04255 family protein [Leptospira santarosai]